MDDQDLLTRFRYFLKDSVRLTIDFSRTDQSLGVPPPPIQKPCPAGTPRISLPRPGAWKRIPAIDLLTAIERRRSRRHYLPVPLSLDELSFLLWITQGVQKRLDTGTALRTVPSAGCRHAFETYLIALNVDGLRPAIYRYLPMDHQLVLVREQEALATHAVSAAHGQGFVGSAAVTFAWAVIPYRMEWRYHIAAHRVILMDAGHVCQNLYLGCEAIGAGCCAIGAFHQEAMDDLLAVDGEEEFTCYLASVGKVSSP